MATGTREALELLEERNGEVEAVITDWHMPPGPSGVWLLENVMHRFPQARRILFTGRNVPHEQRLLTLGLMERVLRKPASASDIIKALEGNAGARESSP